MCTAVARVSVAISFVSDVSVTGRDARLMRASDGTAAARDGMRVYTSGKTSQYRSPALWSVLCTRSISVMPSDKPANMQGRTNSRGVISRNPAPHTFACIGMVKT